MAQSNPGPYRDAERGGETGGATNTLCNAALRRDAPSSKA